MLLVQDNVQKRVHSADPSGISGCFHMKNDRHCLFECPRYIIPQGQRCGFKDLFGILMEMKSEYCALFATIGLYIWFNRNLTFREQMEFLPSVIVAIVFSLEFLKLKGSQTIPVLQ